MSARGEWLETWPERLKSRARLVLDAPPPPKGYVLYWMRVAARDHENPALDAAVASANALGTSVLVYHGVSERYPYASDRHHTFVLEGARDVARGLRRRGIAYALHVERPGARGPFLRALAERAALVVTEDAPVPPLDAWTERLAAHLAARGVPLVAVDASCVVPMPLVNERHERAFAFRDATRALAERTLAETWSDVAPARAPVLPELPFVPIDPEALDDRSLARLVAACAIDHAVGPVRALRGGATAGYARWAAFRSDGLARYAPRRNDAALDGTSRLSPWLHYGHVSPFRIAREAAALRPDPGAEKLLDELLVWRELAWHFAARTPSLDSLDALPAWARATLEAHAADRRDVLPRERLERGQTGDGLWDVAQRALASHGELHNNVRMTWGKAILGWTASPEEARRTLVALNHRYALDGRDPASYGGLYWCLGLFDRPFTPEQRVLGAVRPRPTEEHARRLDVDRYAARVLRPRGHVGRVAIVGAGVAGLACARTLHDHGVDVVVFDKGRTPGGRLASGSARAFGVDLGAQYFTVHDARFERFVRSWIDEGLVAPWRGRIGAVPTGGGAPTDTPPVERLVGVPGMGAIAAHLARDVIVRASHRVDAIERRDGRFHLAGTIAAEAKTLGPRDPASPAPLTDLGAFDVVIVCLPAEQARPLLEGVSPTLAATSGGVAFDPCVALAFTLEGDALPYDGLFVGREGEADRVLGWIARDGSKPQRARAGVWMAHAAPEWSRAHLRDPEETVERALLGEVARVLGIDPAAARSIALRRWAFARAPRPIEVPALFDDVLKIGVGGDWSAGGRVEGAFLSGVALAGRVLGLPDDA